MIKRDLYIKAVTEAFAISPVCALLGPRQCGKSTLAKDLAKNIEVEHFIFDLEDPTDLARLENPKLALEHLDGLIIIDEIQRRPDLFPYLRVLVDRYPSRKILILGSASSELIRQSSETLAGRIRYIEMTPFSSKEVGDLAKLWLRGGFPKSYLSGNDELSFLWRQDYIRTFLERDIREFGFNIPPQTMRRFWMMLAHYHAQTFNASEIARSIDVTNKTSNRYLDILTGTFMIRRLSPWFENLSKRQVKSPKIYFRDSGIFHAILGIKNQTELLQHPKLGFSWEGLAIETVIKSYEAYEEDCYFWGTNSGAELDLLIIKNNKKHGFEFKFTDFPRVSKSMHIALEDLKLETLTVIIPGNSKFLLHDKIQVVGIENYC